MSMTEDPRPLSFTIVDPQEFLSSQSSSDHHHTLPPNFLLSLSYKPLNNTFLSLFSLLSSPVQPLNSQSNTTQADNSSSSTRRSKIHSELILSHSATVLFPDSYYDLWTDLSTNSPLRYSLHLIVMNGHIGMCLGNDYHPPMETVRLWENVESTESLEMKFTPYLNSISSMV